MNTFDKKTAATTPRDQDKKSVSHKVGDTVEKAGTKIANAGAEKIGNAVYKAGDKIEHMNDKKTTR